MRGDSGNAGVPVGNSGERADEHVGGPGSLSRKADEDVGVPSNAHRTVGGPKGWYSRGYLPHRDKVGLLQAVTFRLADSLPQAKLAELQLELEHLPEDRRGTERHRRIEQWLDAGMGCCALGHPEVAKAVQDSLLHFDGERYVLLCWCVMPNHVHVLVEPRRALAGIVQGWKSFTARWALARNDALGLGIPDPKHLWMREYWDRYMRDEDHLRRSMEYIHNNPVKAGLCRRAEDWPWSSARNADVPVGNSRERADGDVGVPGTTRYRP